MNYMLYFTMLLVEAAVVSKLVLFINCIYLVIEISFQIYHS